MYNELYEAWKREKENSDIQPLSKDFYLNLAEYVRKIREENRMLDEKTTRSRLLQQESKNAHKMFKELVSLRYEKLLKEALTGETTSTEGLTNEEEKLIRNVTPSFESYQALLKDVLCGRQPQMENTEKLKKRVLRFLRDVPAIIGADMKTYGPFKPEDVASLPQENAKILVKQGVAVEVGLKL